LTLSDQAEWSKVSLLASFRTHVAGHQLTVVTGSFLATDLVDAAPEATRY
jgi:hypothetical protein